jgi:N,N'-diacetyllegionaminate synthase
MRCPGKFPGSLTLQKKLNPSMHNRTLIIAEVGVNHNGDLGIAKKLIDAAAHAKADMVKFQTFSADDIATGHAPMAEYQQKNSPAESDQKSMLRKLELSMEAHHELQRYATAQGIKFFSTAFDPVRTDFLCSLGFDFLKIPSGEITNFPLLRHIGGLGKGIILSTGMAKLGEIEDAIAVLEDAGSKREQITVLHCNTEYPTPLIDVNLRAMVTIQKAFGVKVGYSDHTLGIEIPIAAVALGACVIEKHLTLNRNMPGPDHRASLEPPEFEKMVFAIRNIESALGDGIKRPSASERKNIFPARRSIVASREILPGETFNEQNLAVKRPAGGLSPMEWQRLFGRAATRRYLPDEQIEL